MNLKEKITKHISDDVGQFDCQSDCPDEVAIFENEHYGETLRTEKYCDECFATKLIEEFKKWLLMQARQDSKIKFRQTKAYELYQRLNIET
uniref:Uncharacterized protein n=2 Tax=viral metagenome TaxID=1070528 RepID=A0A6M3KV66_9ZZZZ